MIDDVTVAKWHEVWHYILIYVRSLFREVPDWLLIILAIILVVGMLIVFPLKSVRNKCESIGLIAFVEYAVLLFFFTVFQRPVHGFPSFNFFPFWSYQAFLDGQNSVMAEKIMNLAAFIPVGALTGMSFRNLKWYHAMLFAMLLSMTIEGMQFVFRRGFVEVDDVIHNALGAALGYGFYSLFVRIWRMIVGFRIRR